MLYKTCVYAITWSAVATGVWTKLTLVKHSKCLPSSNVVTGPYKLQSNTEYNWHTRKTVPSPVQRRRLTPKVCHQRRGCRHHTRARHPESQQLVSFCHYFSYLVVFSIRFIASPSPGIVKVVQPTTYGPFASQWGFFHDGDSKSHAHLNKASSAVSDSFTFCRQHSLFRHLESDRDKFDHEKIERSHGTFKSFPVDPFPKFPQVDIRVKEKTRGKWRLSNTTPPQPHSLDRNLLRNFLARSNYNETNPQYSKVPEA